MSRFILIASLLFIPLPVLADDPPFLGSFTTVSETDCSVEISLLYDGTGILVDTCRIEEGTNINSNKMFSIKWRRQDDLIIVDIDGSEESFIYHTKLPCAQFDQPGSTDGLVGYGTQFWRYPVKCK